MMFGMRGGGGTERLQVEIRGYDMEVAEALADQVKRVVENTPGVTDVRISRREGTPEQHFLIDRQKASEMKLSVNQIADFIQTILMGTQASQFREGGREYRILVKVKDSEKLDVTDILDLTMTNSDGQAVSLKNVVNVQPKRGPQQIERRDRERIITVSAETRRPGHGLGHRRGPRRSLRSVPVPRDFTIGFTGDYEEQQKAFRELLISILLAIFLVYMVMAMQYESLRDPLVVMFSVPLAVIGVVLILLLTGTTFNVQSYIGCIMLGGIVVNNAILLVDYTNLLRRRDKMEMREAIEEAGRRRLRPILMTALTTIIAMIPLALGLRRRQRSPGAAGPGRHRRADQLDFDHADRGSGRLLVLREEKGDVIRRAAAGRVSPWGTSPYRLSSSSLALEFWRMRLSLSVFPGFF